jgi:hypothetical protein
VDPVPDTLLLRKCGSGGNGTRDLWVCGQTTEAVISSTVQTQNCVTASSADSELIQKLRELRVTCH